MTCSLVKAEHITWGQPVTSLGLFYPRSPSSVSGPHRPEKCLFSWSFFFSLSQKCICERVLSNIAKAMMGILLSFRYWESDCQIVNGAIVHKLSHSNQVVASCVWEELRRFWLFACLDFRFHPGRRKGSTVDLHEIPALSLLGIVSIS